LDEDAPVLPTALLPMLPELLPVELGVEVAPVLPVAVDDWSEVVEVPVLPIAPELLPMLPELLPVELGVELAPVLPVDD